MYNLDARYDSRKSFGGKAKVENMLGVLKLYSYGILVAMITTDGISKKATVFGLYSATTTRHIREFLLQNGFEAGSKEEIRKNYLKKVD